MTTLEDLMNKRQRREELERQGKSPSEACEAVYGYEYLEFQALTEDEKNQEIIRSVMETLREFPFEAPGPLMEVLKESIAGQEVIDSIMPMIRQCQNSALQS